MVLADMGETISTIRDVIVLLAPIALIVLTILVRKGMVSKAVAQDAENVIRVLTDSVETFKTENKPASKGLTELIEIKAGGAKIQPVLDEYLKKFDRNQ